MVGVISLTLLFIISIWFLILVTETTLLLREKNQQIEKLEAELEKQQDCKFTSTELTEHNLLEQFTMTGDTGVETQCILCIGIHYLSGKVLFLCRVVSRFFSSMIKSLVYMKSLTDACFHSIVSAAARSE